MFNTSGKFYQDHFKIDPPSDSATPQVEHKSAPSDFSKEEAEWRNSLKEGDEVLCSFLEGTEWWLKGQIANVIGAIHIPNLGTNLEQPKMFQVDDKYSGERYTAILKANSARIKPLEGFQLTNQNPQDQATENEQIKQLAESMGSGITGDSGGSEPKME